MLPAKQAREDFRQKQLRGDDTSEFQWNPNTSATYPEQSSSSKKKNEVKAAAPVPKSGAGDEKVESSTDQKLTSLEETVQKLATCVLEIQQQQSKPKNATKLAQAAAEETESSSEEEDCPSCKPKFKKQQGLMISAKGAVINNFIKREQEMKETIADLKAKLEQEDSNKFEVGEEMVSKESKSTELQQVEDAMNHLVIKLSVTTHRS